MKKVLCFILTAIFLIGAVAPVMAAQEETVTMYAPDGRTKEVAQSKVKSNQKVGWYTEPVTTVYAADGRTKVIPTAEKEANLKVGWYEVPVTKVYAADGRSKVIPATEKNAYLKVGWYDSPIITMYSEDGRTKKIPSSQKDAYKKVGWYYGPVITVYSADERTKKIGANEKTDYLKVGWYEVPMVTVGALDGRSKAIKKKDLEAYKKVGWYYIPPVKVETKDFKESLNYFANRTTVEDYGFRSDIQQFKYKNEGLAYAVLMAHTVYIVLPSKILQVKVDCSFRNPNRPRLGDIISDDDGNIYVVWGQANNDLNKKDTNTIFISKYGPDGTHLKTTGFMGEGYLGINGRTAYPIAYGNCHSAIANGKLVVNYAREMYNGHQSNNVIGVNISDMTPLEFKAGNAAPYVSHSFNQRVIWSKHNNTFVYANQGDGGDTRGFVISYKARNFNTFHFYLQANARGNNAIVNKTFAQMGSLLETSKGIVLIGASAKSIGLKTPQEVQNLFIQIIKPNVWQLGPDFFVGGSKRSGESAYSVNGFSTNSLNPVTDYGVQWLTNYSSRNVIAPHGIVVNDKIVILWNTPGENEHKGIANYTVLASDGKVIIPPTVLGNNIPLNSMEEPIYHNGKIRWASNNKVVSITIPGL